jgi:hypothetical protein
MVNQEYGGSRKVDVWTKPSEKKGREEGTVASLIKKKGGGIGTTHSTCKARLQFPDGFFMRNSRT